MAARGTQPPKGGGAGGVERGITLPPGLHSPKQRELPEDYLLVDVLVDLGLGEVHLGVRRHELLQDLLLLHLLTCGQPHGLLTLVKLSHRHRHRHNTQNAEQTLPQGPQGFPNMHNRAAENDRRG